jgi:hypothetical protein
VILFSFSGCKTPRVAPEAEKPPVLELDYLAIGHQLGVESHADRVGYQEKEFDACAYSSLLPPFKDCHHAYFVLAQFQLSCRASEESNSILSAGDLRPVANKGLRWKAGRNYGQILTDAEGFAEIRAIAERSMKRQQLRVSTGKDFLVILAGASTNVVTPPSWCE